MSNLKFEIGKKYRAMRDNDGGVECGDVVKIASRGPLPGISATECGKHLADTRLQRGEFELVGQSFQINAGDYIDSREFTREECERFCELAVECGHGRGTDFERMISNLWFALGVSNEDNGCLAYYPSKNGQLTNNITNQYRDYLNKEKGMKAFTKDDLKDGMKIELRDGSDYYVCGQHGRESGRDFAINRFNDDLTHDCVDSCDIIRVTDRDGTVLFEREEEPTELTLEEIAAKFGLPVERVRIKK